MSATVITLPFVTLIPVFGFLGASYAALLANFVTHFIGSKNSDLRVTPGDINSVTIAIIAFGVISSFASNYENLGLDKIMFITS